MSQLPAKQVLGTLLETFYVASLGSTSAPNAAYVTIAQVIVPTLAVGDVLAIDANALDCTTPQGAFGNLRLVYFDDVTQPTVIGSLTGVPFQNPGFRGLCVPFSTIYKPNVQPAGNPTIAFQVANTGGGQATVAALSHIRVLHYH